MQYLGSTIGSYVFLVDEDNEFTSAVSQALREIGYPVLRFATSSHAWDELKSQTAVSLIITDTKFDDGHPNGIALVALARLYHGLLPAIFVTTDTIGIVADERTKLVPKPCDLGLLVETARRLAAVGH